MSQISSRKYLIVNDLLCLTSNEQFVDLDGFSEILSPGSMFAFEKKTFLLSRMNKFTDVYDYLVVLEKEQPYSNCVQGYSKFRCLNECFKNGFRLASYYYEGSETGVVHLNQQRNRSIEAHENNCQSKCQRDSCKLVYLFQTKLEEEEEINRVCTFEGSPAISELDFWIQCIGLVGLFFGISFGQLLIMAIEFINLKVKDHRVKKPLYYFKLVTFFIAFLCCICFCIHLILDFKERQAHPIRKETTLNVVEPEAIGLAICGSISNYFEGGLQNKTLSEIERQTAGLLSDLLEDVWLDFQNKTSPVHYVVRPKVLFRNGFSGGISRCVQLAVYPALSEPKYQNIKSSSAYLS